MHTRMMQSQIGLEQIEPLERMIRENVIPELDGFKGGYWLADHETGSVIGITIFESEAALRASAEQADRIREESSRSAGLPLPSFTSYEIVAATGSEAVDKAA